MRTPLRPLARILQARQDGLNPDSIEKENLKVRHEALREKGVEPVSKHGIYMSKLIGDIACPDGDHNCLEQLRHTLAMPRIAATTGTWA